MSDLEVSLSYIEDAIRNPPLALLAALAPKEEAEEWADCLWVRDGRTPPATSEERVEYLTKGRVQWAKAIMKAASDDVAG